jgi:glycine cleavage system H lipoate-binding protein
MTKSVYRTAQGKMIDMGKLVLQNESIKAVGNMNVNARGDLVDDHNRVIASKSQQVNKQYNRQVSNQPTRTK